MEDQSTLIALAKLAPLVILFLVVIVVVFRGMGSNTHDKGGSNSDHARRHGGGGSGF